MSEEHHRMGAAAGEGDGLLKLRDGFLVQRLLFVSQTELPVRIDKTLVQFERLLVLVYRPVVLAHQVWEESVIGVDAQRERLKLMRSLNLGEGFIQAPYRSQVLKAVPVMRGRAVWL